MSVAEIAVPSSTTIQQRAEFISQTTAVEQARAVAEVQAAIIVAQQCPRDMTVAVAQMTESCRQVELADRAFFKFPKGGSTVSGASVHLARELARCFGNVDYGLRELRRDDVRHESEMQVWAWDVQTNTRSSQTFVVPHKRDKRGGAEVLTDLRDIYENNANQGARRLREAIFSILPTWFTAKAQALCAETLTSPGGAVKPLAQQVADAVSRFAELGVKVERLESKLGPRSGWSVHDVAQLRVSFASLQQGTVTVEEEFPSERVTVADIVPPVAASDISSLNEQPNVTPPVSSPAIDSSTTDKAAEDPPGRRLKPYEQLAVEAGKHGLETTEDVIRMVLDITGREVASLQDLLPGEIKECRGVLAGYGPDAEYLFSPAPTGAPPAEPPPTPAPTPTYGDEVLPATAQEWRKLAIKHKVGFDVLGAKLVELAGEGASLDTMSVSVGAALHAWITGGGS